MKIQKLLHSCLLIEDNGKRILIDPGSWSFGEGFLNIDTVGKIDAVFITHSHQDHFNAKNIGAFVTRDACKVYANTEIAALLTAQNIPVTTIKIPETISVGNNVVTSVEAPHGRLPFPPDLNNGFYINHKVFTPGDSFTFEKNLIDVPEVLALPILAPWGTFTEAIELALRLKPKHIIPVHDALIADIFRPRMHQMCVDLLTPAGITVHALKPGEILEI